MNVRVWLGLSASVALLAAAGCAQSQGVVRGQSPVAAPSDVTPPNEMPPDEMPTDAEAPVFESPVAPDAELPPGAIVPGGAVPTAVLAPSPVTGPLLGTAPGYGERPHFKARRHDFKPFRGQYNQGFGYDDGAYDGTEQHYANHQKAVYDVGGAGGCPACEGGMSCPPGGCPHCGTGCGHPNHYATYSYNSHFGHGGWPRNLVYPSPVLPAGMVQYPYYTLRGPTDFFMK